MKKLENKKKENPRADFREEKVLRAQGYRLIAGIDEVGRGPLAGPVVAAAVILPDIMRFRWVKDVKDSKLVTEAKRLELYEKICSVAISWGTGVVDNLIIDKEGINVAARIAMKLAVEQMKTAPDFILIDYFLLPEMQVPQKGVIEGDTCCFSIACASILAKVTRDRIMVELDKDFPGYGFAENKGYGTKQHYNALQQLGVCSLHRRSYEPVTKLIRKENGA